MSVLELSILVVSWNTRDMLRECLRSALASLSGLSAEIIVVDNASADGSAEMVWREFAHEPRVQLIANSRNEGFARGNNQGYAAAHGTFVAVVNPDIVFRGPVLRDMMDHLRAHPGLEPVVALDDPPAVLYRIAAGTADRASLVSFPGGPP